MPQKLLAVVAANLCWFAGCISAPEPLSVLSSVTGISLGSDGEPYVPWSPTTGGATTQDSATSVGMSTDATATDTATDTSPPATGGALPSFDPPGVFGDDVRETDLIGVWTAPWEPAGQADVSLIVAATGAFTWVESVADCSQSYVATGMLWVENSQLILHVETWEKRDPWHVEAVLGGALVRPFRLRLGYSPMGGFLGVAGAATLTHVRNWQGRTFDRIAAGMGPQGSWVAEAELWALVPGELAPALIVRDRSSAELDAAGGATLTVARTWWYPGDEPVAEAPVVTNGAWVDNSPGLVAGAATVVGDSYAYDALHMFTFESSRSLRLGVVSDCGGP